MLFPEVVAEFLQEAGFTVGVDSPWLTLRTVRSLGLERFLSLKVEGEVIIAVPLLGQSRCFGLSDPSCLGELVDYVTLELAQFNKVPRQGWL